jgi:hypothetical protein
VTPEEPAERLKQTDQLQTIVDAPAQTFCADNR